MDGPLRIFAVFLRMGCTSFGGPVAHLGYFHRQFVQRRAWITEDAFTDLLAMCQFLPGPASSQLGFALGLHRGGLPGGVAAWLGFTLPSAVAMGVAGTLLAGQMSAVPGWLLGLKALAVAVVAHAVIGMAWRQSASVVRTVVAALVAGALVVTARTSTAALWAQPVAIAAGALVGTLLLRNAPRATVEPPRGHALGSAVALAAAVGLLLCAWLVPPQTAIGAATAGTYTAGALVFGGGHVVLPLLEAPFVQNHWLPEGTVLAGYSLAQAVPGPLFTLASFLGAAMAAEAGRTAAASAFGAVLLTVAVFLPGLLLVLAAWPWWHRLRSWPAASGAVAGASAAVVGVLAAALVDPVFPAGVRDGWSACLALGCLLLLHVPRVPVVAVVLAAAAYGHWLLA